MYKSNKRASAWLHDFIPVNLFLGKYDPHNIDKIEAMYNFNITCNTNFINTNKHICQVIAHLKKMVNEGID